MLKRAVVLITVLLVGINTAFAANLYDEFNKLKNQVTDVAKTQLDNFAKDLGALMGGGSFHQGKALGVPGFDIGIHVPAKKVNDDNVIVKNADLDTLLLPILQAEVGLPAKFDLIARFTTLGDSTMIGAGVRYGILKKGIPGVPSVSAQAIYNMLDVNAEGNKFSATNISIGGVASINLPIITPYVGVSFDNTSVTPDSAIIEGVEGSASGLRIEAGVNLSLVPFTYLHVGYALIGSETGYSLGLGIKF